MISIIITTYNIEKYIEECLKSVLAQTYGDMEIIVVDDGSTDDTPELIFALAQQDARIKPVLMPENTPGGVAIAANVGMSHATGDYIGFVDGDDWCEPYMFEKLTNALETSGAQVAIGDFKNYDELSGSYYDPSDKRHWLKGIPVGEVLSGEAHKKALLKFNPVPWRKLYRRDFLEANQIRFPEGDYFYEDNPFHWFCITKGDTFILIPDCLCYHRMNRTGQSMSSSDTRLLAMYEHHQTILEWLIANELYETYKEEVVLWVVNNNCWIYDAIKDEHKKDVISRLGIELKHHDLTFVSELISSDKMGNKGRKLTAEALGEEFEMGEKGLAQANAISRITEEKLPLVKEAQRYYQEFGAKATIRKIAEYLYRRMPVPVRHMVGKVRSTSGTSTVNSTQKELKALKTQVEMHKLLTVLSDEKVTEVERKIDKLQSDIDEIKALLNKSSNS